MIHVIKVFFRFTDMGFPKIRQNMACFLYAPLTPCEMERCFSLSEAKYINSAKISGEAL